MNSRRDIQEFAAELMNAACPIGTPVVYIRDNGERFETVTRSEAWLLGSGEAVVKVRDIAGGVSLSRIRVTVEQIKKRLNEATSTSTGPGERLTIEPAS